MLNVRLFPFMDADGGATGAASTQDGGTGTAAQTDLAQAGSAQEGADEPKTGMDVKSEAQKIADAMVAKKLKGMPSKEELAEYRKWKDEQKTEAERLADIQNKAAQALSAAEKREAKASAMIAAAEAGIRPEHIDDAVILAMARMGDDTSIEDAVAKIAQANPSWKAGAKLPESGSNPATGESKDIFEIKRHF